MLKFKIREARYIKALLYMFSVRNGMGCKDLSIEGAVVLGPCFVLCLLEQNKGPGPQRPLLFKGL